MKVMSPGAVTTPNVAASTTAAPFLIGAAVVLAATLGVVTAPGDMTFMVAAVVTGTTIGALGHYSLVHATISRLAPSDRTRSITVNTLWGAFASPVFLPVMGACLLYTSPSPRDGLLS